MSHSGSVSTASLLSGRTWSFSPTSTTFPHTNARRGCSGSCSSAALSRFGTGLGDLSGGMKQKLALSCALIHTPKLLLLDEPTTGVDPLSRRDLWRLLFELWQEGVTIIVSTPYMDEAERCSRVGFLNQGRLIATGRPEDLRSRFKGT